MRFAAAPELKSDVIAFKKNMCCNVIYRIVIENANVLRPNASDLCIRDNSPLTRKPKNDVITTGYRQCLKV